MTWGRYADGTEYSMPDSMAAASETLLETAGENALLALRGGGGVDRMRTYYNRGLEYAGTSFADIAPNDPSTIDVSDLFAVSRLSMTITNVQSRRLLDDDEGVATTARNLLADIPVSARLERDLSEGLLVDMWKLHDHFRTVVKGTSNRWVFAAKLCARKRPDLFPVRDSVVCTYLSGGPMGDGPEQMGRFAADIQIFAHLMARPDIRAELTRLRREAAEDGTRVDRSDLKLLDAVVWMRGMQLKRGR